MFPFDDTPNRGGVYKVWLIAQSSAVPGCDPAVDIDGKHLSFPHRCAKSDNFKVDFQARPACSAWHDDFDQGVLDLTRWVITSGPAPGSSPTNIGTFDPAHVSLAGGLLTLTLTQQQNGQSVWLSTGALIHTQVPCGYGTYEWTMRMSSSTNGPSSTGVNVSGGVSAGFTFANNSEHEIAFEHSAHASQVHGHGTSAPDSIWLVNFHNTDPNNPNHDPEVAGEGTETEHPLPDVFNEFHHYKFIWKPGSIRFFIDNQEITEHTTNVPSAPGFFMMTHFGRNFGPWGGPATVGTRYFFVRRAAFTPLN
jgi:beta-glucanase (GH16 family)